MSSTIEKNKIKKELKNDIYCEKCDNILDITRTIAKTFDGVDVDSGTPKELSSDGESENSADEANIEANNEVNDEANDDDDDGVDYGFLLKKIEDGEKLTNDELRSINIKNMVKHEYYRKMAKKGEIKKNIIDMIEDLKNSDDNTHAYMICKNCGFNKPIDPRFRIMSRNPVDSTDTNSHTMINEDFYRNRVHVRTLPITRNFNCPNKECPVYKDKLAPEAVFFRKNPRSYELVYVCKRCLTVKMI